MKAEVKKISGMDEVPLFKVDWRNVNAENNNRFWETFYGSPSSMLKEAMSLRIENSIYLPDPYEDDQCTVEVSIAGYGVDTCYKAVAAAESFINELNSISRKIFSLKTLFTAYGCLVITIKESETLRPE